MPYKVRGKEVWHKVGSRWTRKARTKSHRNAVKVVGLLHKKGYGGRETS